MTSLVEALGRGDVDEVAALIALGHDIHYRRGNGYAAAIDAVHGRDVSRDRRLLDLLSLLVRHEVDLNVISSYQESALRRLSHVGRFDAVRLLLEAGADANQLEWTPLMTAVALGSVDDVRRQLRDGVDLEALDWWQRTAFHLALMTGDVEKIELLFEHGANADAAGRVGPALFYAIEGHHPHVVQWLLDAGADVNQTDQSGITALMYAAEQADAECVQVLADAGADLDRDVFGTALHRAHTRAVVERLLAAGADPATLSGGGIRALLGLPPDPDERLLTATPEEFSRAATRRFGARNPERMNEPFWLSMIRAGVDAYSAGVRFGARMSACPREPVWCAKRFGQSVTRLPDGRLILIGGEHEDHYDPDFCIYNDVFVQAPDGSIDILGYPELVFPPTDFHTATHVGNAIYVIGALGYRGRRQFGVTPVYRLDLETLAMQRLDIGGEPPGWIYGHRADAAGEAAIRIRGGTVLMSAEGREGSEMNYRTYVLDLDARIWSRED